MRQFFLLLSVVAFGATAQSAPKIKQIDTNKKRVAVQATSKTSVGTEWVATDKKGQQCTMTVTDKVAGVAILNARDCNIKALRVGQTLQKSVFTSSKNLSGRTGSSIQNWDSVREQLKGVSLIGFYSMADEFPAREGSVSGTFVSESSFGFGAEYEYSVGDTLVQDLPISIVGGVTYEMARDISKIKVNGQTQSYSTKPSVALWDFYANAQLNLTDRLSGFAGLNYAIPLEKNFGDDKTKSGFGYQVGASAKLTSSLAVDGIYRWINFKTNEIEEVDLDGFVIRGRYLF